MPGLVAFVDGNVVPASQLIQRDPIYAAKSADQAVNNSTVLVNASGMLWTLQPSATYEYRILLLQDANTTANFKLAFTFPAGARMDFGIATYVIGGVNTALFSGFVNYASGTAIGVSGSGGVASIHIDGKIDVGVTGGVVQTQFAQNTANASNSNMKAGSHGTFRQVA